MFELGSLRIEDQSYYKRDIFRISGFVNLSDRSQRTESKGAHVSAPIVYIEGPRSPKKGLPTSSSSTLSVATLLFFQVALASQLFCWTGQFVGHAVFEVSASSCNCGDNYRNVGDDWHFSLQGRAPALLTNLSQALLMAPFFVLLEVRRGSTSTHDRSPNCSTTKLLTDAHAQVLRLFGYEPYPGFDAAVRAKIETDREAWRARKQKKSS